MAENLPFDVFLSYGRSQQQRVSQLAERLRDDGLRVWFDNWEIRPGDLIQATINKGLESSRVLLFVISPDAIASEWPALEARSLRFRDPESEERRFIPIRFEETVLPEALTRFAILDWVTKPEANYSVLLAACQSARDAERRALTRERRFSAAATLSEEEAQLPYVSVTPDGLFAVSGGFDRTLRLWDLASNRSVAALRGHTQSIWCVAISPDGRLAFTGSPDKTIGVWDCHSRTLRTRLTGHRSTVGSVAFACDAGVLISGSHDSTMRLWNIQNACQTASFEHPSAVYAVAITADGLMAVTGSADGIVRLWDVRNQTLVASLAGHRRPVQSVALTADGSQAVSGSIDQTVLLWDLNSHNLVARLEGHTRSVTSVAITPDGRRAVSGSDDGTARVWDLQTGETVGVLFGHTNRVSGVAMSQTGERVISGSFDKTLQVWTLPAITKVAEDLSKATRYTNAKVLLVGDSGVGKTGLAYRLTENCFKGSVSTDAAWATQMKVPYMHNQKSSIEREIWLWDFAGQADYRLIHQLYMDETALAILVFNPQSENPFEGLGQWDQDLQRAARRRFNKLLVAGRIDRGGLMLSRDTVERFRLEHGFAIYVETSALKGTGCEELKNAIISNIGWDDIPWIASPRIFRLLKEQLVKLKDEGKVLLRLTELKQQLEMRLPTEDFTTDQLRSVVALLAGPGVVWQLEFGDFVLLQPERINAYAAAVIRSVRAHTEEIGCIAEEKVWSGNLDYQDMKRLPHQEEQIVLRAMHQTFVDHGLCLREHTEGGTLLIFPSYFKRERPDLQAHPLVLVTYRFHGPLDEIYATLVVRLHHTPTFERDRLWRFAADFKTPAGKRLGLRMSKKGEGAGEMKVYFEAGISPDIEVTFIRYVHDHLTLKAKDVVRERHYICIHCGEAVENQRAIRTRLEKGLKDIVCVACEGRVPLWDLIEEKFASEEFQKQVLAMEERARAAIDNESRELILEGHARAITGEAGQIYRGYTGSDHGIDGEIEFKDARGRASGKRVYLQLKSGDSYLSKRKADSAEIFTIKKERWAEYWQQQAYPVMLVIRTSDGAIRWMNISHYLRKYPEKRNIVFEGEPFTAVNLVDMKRRLFPHLEAAERRA
jgi:small GTP-binding protein